MHKIILMMILTMISAVDCIGRPPEMIVPKPLKPGSKIAIVTPASAVKAAVIDSAVSRINARGYEAVVYPHAKGNAYGSYAANDSVRAAELMQAFKDPEIDAILCARGGYGTVRLLPLLNTDVVRSNPKWLIGYSDISDLHAFMYHSGVASVHGPMAAHLAEEPDTTLSTQYLFEALANGPTLKYSLEPSVYNKGGIAKGRIVGGNLLTINGLAETQYDVLNIADEEDLILFIEDVSEQIYAIERVLMRLHYSGALSRVKGIIIGQFNKYKPSEDFGSMEEMIHYWLNQWGYYNPHNPMPIVYDFPTGHVTDNYPMICGAEAVLLVSPFGTSLSYTGI